VDIFRTQLWWDHLPSPVNFLRGKATPEDAKCLYCDAPGIVTSWHILAKCTNAALVSARRAATVGIHTAIADGFGRNAVESRNMMTKVLRLTATGEWLSPEGWDFEERRKAGLNPNPWYGCLPTEWLDTWVRQAGVGDHQRHWDTGCAKFGKVSTAAVAGCHLVWREAMKMWGKAQREIRMRGGRRGISSHSGRGKMWRVPH
jgi:hypothetical protein